MKEATDEQLITQYLAGNEPAFAVLVERYLPLVYGFSRQYSGDKDKAADIAQETFIKVWRNIKKFDKKKSFRPWLFAITKNTALDWLKRKNEIPFSSFASEDGEENFIENIADPALSPAVLAENKMFAEKIENHFTELLTQYHSVVSMHVSDGLTFKEISKLVKAPLNTVKSQYRRALLLLKKQIIR